MAKTPEKPTLTCTQTKSLHLLSLTLFGEKKLASTQAAWRLPGRLPLPLPTAACLLSLTHLPHALLLLLLPLPCCCPCASTALTTLPYFSPSPNKTWPTWHKMLTCHLPATCQDDISRWWLHVRLHGTWHGQDASSHLEEEGQTDREWENCGALRWRTQACCAF